MYILYNSIGFFFLLVSPLIILFRLLISKEDPKRFLEKFSIFKKENIKETIWFHGSSVGEIMSILPIIESYEKNNKIKKILLTSSTISSASVIKKKSLKKTTHLYYPFDVNFICHRFLKKWKPKIAVFVDSEVWPNMYKILNSKKIPIILINGRITKKSFEKWLWFPSFAKEVFGKITIALPQNKETKKYLKILGVKKIKLIGNLKYFKNTQKKLKYKSNVNFSKRKIFCAASTHYNEERIIGKLHLNLRKNYKSLLTILIPRHIDRTNEIIKELTSLKLKVIKRSSKLMPKASCDIYLVDTYGEMSKFLKLSNLTFIGGSLIPHGGQNPLEAVRMGNFVLHGNKINNFIEIYDLLKKFKLATNVNNLYEMEKVFKKKINFKPSKNILNKIDKIGKDIFKKNIQEINNYL